MKRHQVFALHLEPVLLKIEQGTAHRGPFGFQVVELSAGGGVSVDELLLYKNLLSELIQLGEHLSVPVLRQIFYDMNNTFACKLSWPGDSMRAQWAKMQAKNFGLIWNYMWKNITRSGAPRHDVVKYLKQLAQVQQQSVAGSDVVAAVFVESSDDEVECIDAPPTPLTPVMVEPDEASDQLDAPARGSEKVGDALDAPALGSEKVGDAIAEAEAVAMTGIFDSKAHKADRLAAKKLKKVPQEWRKKQKKKKGTTKPQKKKKMRIVASTLTPKAGKRLRMTGKQSIAEPESGHVKRECTIISKTERGQLIYQLTYERKTLCQTSSAMFGREDACKFASVLKAMFDSGYSIDQLKQKKTLLKQQQLVPDGVCAD